MASTADTLDNLEAKISVLTGADISDKYETDNTFVNHCKPNAVYCPSTTEEVAAVLRACNNRKQAVVVQGGLTGLAGGATPTSGEVAISLERLSGIEEIDEQSMTMTVKSGTPLQVIQEAALDKGLVFPMDIGSRGTATIGGNVSTNAGGVQVIRYGMTRSLIMGLEVVLADGTVITSLNKMLKNNAGYDLKHLFIGAEGTLGVVTRVVVRLFPKPKSRCTALLAFPRFEDTVSVLKEIQANMVGLVNSYEVMWDNYYEYVAPTVESFQQPFDGKHGAYAILELCGNDQEHDSRLMESFLSRLLERELLADVVIAQSDAQSDNIWSVRHGIGAFASDRPLINFDVSIPIGQMDAFTKQLLAMIETTCPHVTMVLFGHIGDSNLHVVIGDFHDEEFSELKDSVHELTGKFSGSISAEHGIGKLKTGYLGLSRSAEEIGLMKSLKQTLDPNHILNRGRVIQTL